MLRNNLGVQQQKFRRIIARGYKSKCGQHKELVISITESLTES